MVARTVGCCLAACRRRQTARLLSPALLPPGPDGELRARIEHLEKDVVIQRNRADVNALFKEEHDRWEWAGGGGSIGVSRLGAQRLGF